MTKILVLGANGLIGANVIYSLIEFSSLPWQIVASVRQGAVHGFKRANIATIQVEDYFQDFDRIVLNVEPEFVINCVGVVSQNFHLIRSSEVIKLNSLLPHFLEERCKKYSVKLLNISTDCVFSMRSGDNNEDSESFALDVYGTSKRLGEIRSQTARTIRLSSVGFEHATLKHGLLEWYLNTNLSEVSGFSNAVYSGTAGSEVFRILEYAIEHWNHFELLHYPGHEINKYELLCLFDQTFRIGRKIAKEQEPVVKRNLKSKHVSVDSLGLPNWETQMQNLGRMRKYYE